MYFVLFIIITMIVYAVSFKNDFTKEHLAKTGQLIAIFSIAILLLGILGSIV